MKNSRRTKQCLARNWLGRWLSLMDAYPLYMLGLIFVLGMIAALILNRDRLPPAPDAGENDTWWAIALNLANGEGYSLCITRYFPFCGPANQTTATREPLPVLLFAGIALLSGESLWAAVIAELLIYLSILIAVYFLTLEWSSTRAALLAAAFWGIYIPAHELISQVSGDLLAALLVCMGILFMMRARQSRNSRDWFIAGVSLGLAVVTRSGTLVVAAVVIAGVALESWQKRFHRMEIFVPGLILSSLVLLLMAPWLIRNTIVFGRPVLGSSLIGYNLYRHNYMIGTRNYLRHVGGREGLMATEALLTHRPDLIGVENEAQMDLIYRDEAIKLIRAHPVQYALLSAYRFLPLWFNWGFPQAYGREPSRTDYAVMLLQCALLILALVGVRPVVGRTWPLWGSILAISLVYMAVDSRLLYLTPVMPLAISLTAGGGVYLLGKIFPRFFKVEGAPS
ncbi:MAG TPA: glycosyltransferase family 39 protein [Anaerolineales bacterium]|nr:glycosyltransferase family 39 protein [Anaerolineales bacterium]